MCACALVSVNDVPVWGQRALVPRNTYSESACWYAGQIAKLTVPLSYNFLTFLPQHIRESTIFYQFLGRLINLTPLGTGFDFFFPIFILIPVCAALFNLYGKVKRWFGFDILEDEDEENNPSGFGTGGWREGRDLISRDLQGPGSSTIGLTDSPRPSADLTRTGRANPTRWVPPDEWETTTEATSRNTASSRASQPLLDPEPDEESFFTLFGRRVKNTIDGIDGPRWMQNSPLKKPKWMGGGALLTNNGGNSSSRPGPGRRIGSLFGGRGSNEGQLTI